MNSKLTLAAALWLAGFVAGVVLIGRWRRMGGAEFDISAPEPLVEEASTTSAGKVQRAAGRIAGPVVAGAKADLLTVRNATKKVSHRGSPSIAEADAASMN
jgi:hypothetical protein